MNPNNRIENIDFDEVDQLYIGDIIQALPLEFSSCPLRRSDSNTIFPNSESAIRLMESWSSLDDSCSIQTSYKGAAFSFHRSASSFGDMKDKAPSPARRRLSTGPGRAPADVKRSKTEHKGSRRNRKIMTV